MAVPYYQPADPIVPDANRSPGPEIVLKGLASLADMANARDRVQIESEKMLLDAGLTKRGQDIARENNQLDYQVGMENAKAYGTWRTAQAAFETDATNPLSRAGRMRAAIMKERDWVDFAKEASPLIDEPNPKNPVDYYSKYQRLFDSWQFSNDTRVSNALKDIKMRTEQQAIPLREGFKFDEKKKTWVAAGDPKPIPVGQIIDNLNDPEQSEKTWQMLERNGYVTSETKDVKVPGKKPQWLTDWMQGKDVISRGIGSMVGAMMPSGGYPATTKTLSPSFSKYMQMSEGVDFSRGKPRTPAAGIETADNTDLPQSDVDEAAAALATESGASVSTPPPPENPTFQATETDKILATARRYYNMPGADKVAIRARLQNDFHIDPARLDETE